MAPHDPVHAGVNGYFSPAWRFNFFQAVKLLESLVREQRRLAGQTEVVPAGSGAEPEEEPVRFRSRVTLAFPASDLYEIDVRPKDGGTPIMTVDFMGLVGSRGPLPDFWAEMVRDRERRGDGAMRAFLDIFNHRLISLFYRVRQRHRPTLHTGPIENHPFSRYLLAFGGLGTPAARAIFEAPAVRDGLELKSRDLILYTGLLWNRDRSMTGLERLLAHALGLKVKGRPLCGRWLRIPEDERSRLTAGESQNRLGISAVAGARIWDPQAGFELRLGPMKWSEFSEYLPTGRRFGALLKLVRFYVRSAFDFVLVLVLESDEAQRRPALSATDGPRLGWTSWTLTRPLPPQKKTVEVRVPGRMLDEDVP
jgi:type VI secretion system protein ImpH